MPNQSDLQKSNLTEDQLLLSHFPTARNHLKENPPSEDDADIDLDDLSTGDISPRMPTIPNIDMPMGNTDEAQECDDSDNDTVIMEGPSTPRHDKELFAENLGMLERNFLQLSIDDTYRDESAGQGNETIFTSDEIWSFLNIKSRTWCAERQNVAPESCLSCDFSTYGMKASSVMSARSSVAVH